LKISAREPAAALDIAGPEVPENADPPPLTAPLAEVASEPVDASALERRFFATTEPEERGAVAEELWTLNSIAALTTLYRLLHAESNPDVKMDIISGLVDAESAPETRELRWALLVAGLARNQPSPVRELAAAILADAEDPRAVTLLQTFENDPDEEVRETVRSGLEDLREAAAN
jgi:HEAT repeat protein